MRGRWGRAARRARFFVEAAAAAVDVMDAGVGGDLDGASVEGKAGVGDPVGETADDGGRAFETFRKALGAGGDFLDDAGHHAGAIGDAEIGDDGTEGDDLGGGAGAVGEV